MNIINYCDKHNIKWFPINLSIKKTKNLISMNKKHHKLYPDRKGNYTEFKRLTDDELKARQELINEYEYIAIDTYDIYQIDVDETGHDDILEQYKDFPYYLSATKQLKHILVKDISRKNYGTKKDLIKSTTKKGAAIELLSGQWAWIHKNGNILNEDKEPLETNIYETFNLNFINVEPTLKKSNKEEKEKKEEHIKKVEEYKPIKLNMNIKDKDEELVKKLLEIIKPEYRDNLNDWMRIIWSLNGLYYDLGLEFTKTSPLYKTEDYYKEIFMKTNGSIKIGTLYYYSRISNEDEYLKIRAEYFKDYMSNTDHDLARVFNELSGGDNWLYNEKKIYKFNGIYWEEQNCELSILKYIRDCLLKFYTNIFNVCFQEFSNDSKKFEEYNKIIKSIKTQKTMKNICEAFYTLISVNNKIMWNSKPYKLVFNNGVYNLENGKLEKGLQSDYMSFTTGYDLIDDEERENIIRDLLKTIFPIEDERTAYMTILGTGCIGEVLEKLIIANGGGGNGKGVLNDLFLSSLGEYGTTLQSSVLLKPIQSGNNPELCLLKQKRFVVSQEPDEGNGEKQTKINGATIKQITGGSYHNVKDLYQTSNQIGIYIYITLVLECNQKLLISGTIDNSMLRRLIDIYFRSTFTNNKELLDDRNDEDYIYEANEYYKTAEFKDEYKSALMNVILKDYMPTYIKNKKIDDYLPASIIERTNQYLENSDELYTWFKENYTKLSKEQIEDKEDKEYIKISDIYDDFKTTDFYREAPKERKRTKYNKSGFIELIKCNKFLKRDYKERYTFTKDSKRIDLKNVLINYVENEDF